MNQLVKFFICFVLICNINSAQYQITKVDFLERLNLNYNAAAPVLTKFDTQRNRLIAVHANSSMVSIINGKDHSVINIPIQSRAIQHLKEESLQVDSRTGNVYLVGKRCLHVIYPDKSNSKTFSTDKQYEMAAVDENTGNVFLVGRESSRLAFIYIKTEEVKYIKWLDFTAELVNINQTPPPPIRKVVSDHSLKIIFALDGYTSTLFAFNSETGELLRKRKLELGNGARWHYAGYNQNTHHLYVVVETGKRKVVQATKIDVQNAKDVVVELPGYTEGVGIIYNQKLDEVYIPYDNHPLVHVVNFKNGGELSEIKIPFYGNDASAIDEQNNLLFIASWAYGEIEIVDLTERKFVRRIPDLGIIPHTFNMEFNSVNNTLYIPIGANAVNGTFGSAITAVNVEKMSTQKIYTGWAPIDLVQRKGSDEFIVFNSEDEFAIVKPDGNYSIHKLPFDYPHQAIYNNEGNIYLSYGPHQSYWPTVYIWGAKNGIMQINPENLNITDRRIPRLAHEIVLAKNGALYALQNTWGTEKQFITVLEDEVREFDSNNRIVLEEEVTRETIQRILKYDDSNDYLYLVKSGELDDDKGVLQIIDTKTKRVIKRIETGVTPTDLDFNGEYIFITNFDSNTLTRIAKSDYSTQEITTGDKPLKIIIANGIPYVINHNDNTLQEFGSDIKTYKLPDDGFPDNLTAINDQLIVTSHSKNALFINSFNIERKEFSSILKEDYPYGETSFDTNNSAFYVRGQFGDAVFEITKIKADDKGRIWITDYLSGKLLIVVYEI